MKITIEEKEKKLLLKDVELNQYFRFKGVSDCIYRMMDIEKTESVPGKLYYEFSTIALRNFGIDWVSFTDSARDQEVALVEILEVRARDL